MIEIVADRGYEAIKIRKLVLLAGISSPAFYEHFESKENCSPDDVRDGRPSCGHTYRRGRSRRARLAPAATPRLCRVRRRTSDHRHRPVRAVRSSRLLPRTQSMSRVRLLAGREEVLSGLTAELITLRCVIQANPPTNLRSSTEERSGGTQCSNLSLPSRSLPGGNEWTPDRDRAVILTAVGKLVEAHEYSTTHSQCGKRLRSVFHANFDNVEEGRPRSLTHHEHLPTSSSRTGRSINAPPPSPRPPLPHRRSSQPAHG
jgi:AcrR family transcriptional regulator